MKKSEAAAIASASRELLHRGDAVGAERVLSPIINDLRAEPSALHLMGLIKKSLGQLDEAERYLRKAIAQALTDGGYYNDLGVVLQARGAYVEAIRIYRAALALIPQVEPVRVNLVRCLIASGAFTEAEAEARTYIAAHPGAESWTLLSQVQRAQERHEQAAMSAEKALSYAPQLRGLRLNHAAALERAGRPKEAAPIYKDLAAKALDSHELALKLARNLYLNDDRKQAEIVLEEAVKTWPIATLHGPLARMRLARGQGDAATALLEEAIAAHPEDVTLRLAAADALHRGKHSVKALDILGAGLRRAPDDPSLLTASSIVLDEVDRVDDALTALRRVVQITQGDRTAQRNLLSALLRARQPDEALALARALRLEDADEQYLIAIEATAQRMLGNDAYRAVFDYDRVVRLYQIEPPRGFFTAENFNTSLAEALRQQHRVNAHPLDQHLHHGTQTGRTLLTLEEPNIKAFLGAVDAAVRDYISRLKPDASDPVARRRTDRYRYAGLWSVRLGHEGFQPNHVHDRGWISSAYYASILGNERPSDPRAGWLKFGEPHRPLPNMGPEIIHEPKVGGLLLFPSYLWHGTVPFEGSERLSLAFDVIPG